MPEHLTTIILSKIELKMGIKAAATVRLVSKSWRAAFNAFAARVRFDGRKPEQLKALCQLLPQMKKLRIDRASKRLNLQWTADLSSLTSLSLCHESFKFTSKEAMDCKLSGLPTTLRHLYLDGVNVVLEPADKIKLPLLTKLSFFWEENTPSDVWRLLLCLPNSSRWATQKASIQKVAVLQKL